MVTHSLAEFALKSTTTDILVGKLFTLPLTFISLPVSRAAAAASRAATNTSSRFFWCIMDRYVVGQSIPK
ncbi:hypothetical protein Droror1_Dr00000084 [Drosera rotundifolia]